MPFVENREMTKRGVSYHSQKACYLSSYARIQTALSMPLPVQQNAFVNGNQNAQPNANANAHQLPQTAVNTTVQPTAQNVNQNPQHGVANDDGHHGGEFPGAIRRIITPLSEINQTCSAVDDNATVVKESKAINAWVVFRSYNQKALMFVGERQGFRSTLLKEVWKLEPFKAKFEIMGKAITRIRAIVGKEKAAVGGFIEMCAPLMRVLNVDDYFETFGLKYTIDANNKLHLIGEITIPSKDLYNTSISANDLIRACHERGFFEGELSTVLLPGDHFEQGVAVASDQLHSSEVNSLRSGPRKHDTGAVTVFRYPEGYLEAKAARKVLHPSQFSPGGCPAQQNGLLSKSSAYSLGSIKYQQRLLADKYPYYASFDPDQHIAYVYHPWIGDASDAFEIGGGFSDAHAYRP